MPEPDLFPLNALTDWAVPAHGLRVETIDAHVGGQSLRLILKGVPRLQGRTMMERWDYAGKHFDHLRRSLLFEPRGHPEMVGCLLTPPQHRGSHCGALFMHRGGFSPMCGHGIIALTTILLESGLMEIKGAETRLRIDTPAGTVRSYGRIQNDRVERVFFENVPSRVVAADQRVEVPGRGEVAYDLVYAGALFALVEAGALGIYTGAGGAAVASSAGEELLKLLVGPVRQAVADYPLFGVVLRDAPIRRRTGRADLRQVCVFADGCVDRSAGALALCARLALLEHRGEISEGDTLTVEGITGSTFKGRIVGWDPDVKTGGVICEVEGQAWITGRHTFLIAADDPFRSGFLL